MGGAQGKKERRPQVLSAAGPSARAIDGGGSFRQGSSGCARGRLG